MTNQNLQVTSISTLKDYMRGDIIELPSFSDGKPFVARITRPSMLALAKGGKIPNTLLTTATELFTDGGSAIDSDNPDALASVWEVMDVICRASFVEPSYDDILANDITLTDEQYMFIFNYSQRGVEALNSFR